MCLHHHRMRTTHPGQNTATPTPLGPLHHLCPDDLQPVMLANQSTSPMARGHAEAHPTTLQSEEAPIPSALGPCMPPPEAGKPCPRHKKIQPRALAGAAVGPVKPSVERLHVEKKHPPNRLFSPYLMTATYVPPSPEHAGDEDD